MQGLIAKSIAIHLQNDDDDNSETISSRYFPGRTLVGKVASKAYAEYLEIAGDELRDLPVSVQFDGWTTMYGNSYFGTVVTYMINGELRQVFPGEALKDVLRAVLCAELRLKLRNVIVAVTDGASNMQKTLKLDPVLEDSRVACCIHQLVLAFSNANNKNVIISKMLTLLGKFLGMFQTCYSARRYKLLEYPRNRGIRKPKHVLLPVSTRWNCWLESIRRFVWLMECGGLMTATADDLGLTDDQWSETLFVLGTPYYLESLKGMLPYLDRLQRWLHIFQTQTFPTISLVQRCIDDLMGTFSRPPFGEYHKNVEVDDLGVPVRYTPANQWRLVVRMGLYIRTRVENWPALKLVR